MSGARPAQPQPRAVQVPRQEQRREEPVGHRDEKVEINRVRREHQRVQQHDRVYRAARAERRRRRQVPRGVLHPSTGALRDEPPTPGLPSLPLPPTPRHVRDARGDAACEVEIQQVLWPEYARQVPPEVVQRQHVGAEVPEVVVRERGRDDGVHPTGVHGLLADEEVLLH